MRKAMRLKRGALSVKGCALSACALGGGALRGARFALLNPMRNTEKKFQMKKILQAFTANDFAPYRYIERP